MKTTGATAKSHFTGKLRAFRSWNTTYCIPQLLAYDSRYVFAARFTWCRLYRVGYRRPLARPFDIWQPDRGWVRYYVPPVRVVA